MRLIWANSVDWESDAGANPSSGRDNSFWATARTTYGVTSTISSVWLLIKSWLLKSAPRTGNESMPGIPLTACLVCSWIRPAIAIEPPEGISSVVSARRVLMEGIVVPPAPPFKEFSVETSDTSVITRRLIRPSLSTTGVKLSEIPNFLKLAVWTQFPIAPPVVVWQVTPVGIGNSPPEINVADSPEIAVRLGSARVRTTPAVSIARSVAWTVGVEPNDVVRALVPTSGALFAVNGLLLLNLTTAVPY